MSGEVEHHVIARPHARQQIGHGLADGVARGSWCAGHAVGQQPHVVARYATFTQHVAHQRHVLRRPAQPQARGQRRHFAHPHQQDPRIGAGDLAREQQGQRQ
jgi:hypothetical protein